MGGKEPGAQGISPRMARPRRLAISLEWSTRWAAMQPTSVSMIRSVTRGTSKSVSEREDDPLARRLASVPETMSYDDWMLMTRS